MSRKTIRIACLGTPSDYRSGLVPLIIQKLGFQIDWVRPSRADLLIYGSFYDANAPRLRWLPRSWRKRAGDLFDAIEQQLNQRDSCPVTLFHTAENLRHDHIKADYAISHDVGVVSDKHFRLPYWMEMIDWSHEGLVGNSNPRYGELLKLEKLQAPLGDAFLKRAQKAVLITSHLREPRAACLTVLQALMPVDGMGPYFDESIKDHHRSQFTKKAMLQSYAFNLCPENGIHPGYVTEKIPEAFAAGCLPITFVDEALSGDFNPKAMINLATMMTEDSKTREHIKSSLTPAALATFANEALLLQTPSIYPLEAFVKGILEKAITFRLKQH